MSGGITVHMRKIFVAAVISLLLMTACGISENKGNMSSTNTGSSQSADDRQQNVQNSQSADEGQQNVQNSQSTGGGQQNAQGSQADKKAVQAEAVGFISSMGCSDVHCTDTSHYHHCDESCSDATHYHDCDTDCDDATHHHTGTGYHAETSHHEDRHHGSGHH